MSPSAPLQSSLSKQDPPLYRPGASPTAACDELSRKILSKSSKLPAAHPPPASSSFSTLALDTVAHIPYAPTRMPCCFYRDRAVASWSPIRKFEAQPCCLPLWVVPPTPSSCSSQGRPLTGRARSRSAVPCDRPTGTMPRPWFERAFERSLRWGVGWGGHRSEVLHKQRK